MEVTVISKAEARRWVVPEEVQRKYRETKKHEGLVEYIEENEEIPDVIMLGTLPNDPTIYIVDGQHRQVKFLASRVNEAFARIRWEEYDTMEQIGLAFYTANGGKSLLTSADDMLRSKHLSSPPLYRLVTECPFIGFDYIRFGDGGPVMSASAAVKSWIASGLDKPRSALGKSVGVLVDNVTDEETEDMIRFYKMCYKVWGKDKENRRMWLNINVALCAWLYRRLVLGQKKIGRLSSLTEEEFEYCLATLAANDIVKDSASAQSAHQQNAGRYPQNESSKTLLPRYRGKRQQTHLLQSVPRQQSAAPCA